MISRKLLLLIFGIVIMSQMIYAQVPSFVPTNGLVGYWPFNGNANDQSGNNLNGTITGATLTNDRNGNANGAYLFNSSVTSNISIQTQSVTGTGLQNQFSIVMWVKANRVANYIGESNLCPGSVSVPMANSNQNWAFVPGNSGSNLGIGFSLGTNGVMVAEHANNILVSRLSNSSTYSNFVQVAIVYDSSNSYLYVNGALVRTRPMYCSSNAKRIPSLITLGTSLYSPNFSGIIDDLGVWNRALTASEIQLLYTGCSTASPTGSASQSLCSGSTVANLTATGTNIKWYATSTGGTALAATTALVNGTTYYASQTVNGCESATRLAVTVTLNNPTVSASATTVCSGQSTTLTATSGASTTSNFSVGSIGPSGGYVFYDQGSVINGWRYLEASPIDNGSDSGTGCYCVSIPNTSTAIGTGRTNTTNWINAGCNGGFINTATTFNINGNTNWFIPSKDELNLMYSTLKLNNLGNFQNVQYWTSSPASYGSCGINGGAWVLNFTNGTQYSDYRAGYQGAGNLRLIRQFASGTPFTSYTWSTGATTTSISVTPTTTTQYWVDVTTNGVTCRKFIIITVNSTTPAPTGSTTQTLCSGSTVANLTATGTNIKWYATSTGGTALASTTALVNGTTYYASQTVGGCESTTRLTITVSLNNPTVSASATTVCSGQPTTLTASSGASTTSDFSVGSIGPSGGYVFYDQGSVINGWRYLEAAPANIQNSIWGCGDVNISGATSLAIGSGLSNTNAIVATCTTSTIAAKRCLDHSVNGYNDWYLPSQNEFAQIYQNLILNNLGNFNVGAIPSFGTLYWTSTQLTAASGSHCCLECGGNFFQFSKVNEIYVRPIRQFASATPFSSYLWSTGATTVSISVNPTTATQYWVDVTTNGVTCRKFITITVNSTTPAPTGSATQTLCSGSTVANLTATGTNIKWYATSTGGTALASTTALVNGTTYYASQTVGGCESATRLAATVILNNPTVSASATTVCSGQASILTASDGNNSQQIDNKAASFDTTYNKKIDLPYPSKTYPSINFSYDFWFNTSRTITLIPEKTGGNSSYGGTNNQNYAVLPSFQSQAPFLRGTGVSVGTNGIVILEHCPFFIDSRLTYSANLNGWHHCAVVYQNNVINLYLDGVFITSRNNGANFGGNGTTYNNAGLIQSIGLGYNGRLGTASDDHYTGKLDEYRHWSVALSSNQVSQIYNRKLQSVNLAECNLNLTFDQSNIDNNSIVNSGLTLSNITLPNFSSDNTFQIGGFTGTTINSITNTNFTGTSSSSYSWSTGQTSQTITVIPAQTTQYWVDVTTNGTTCRKYITINVSSTTSAPTGVNNQTMTQDSTLANLVVAGQNIVWYSTSFGGKSLPANTKLVNGVTYYASQTINGCESQFRLPVIVQVTLSNNEFDTIKIVYNPNPVINILYIKASIELKNAKICNLLGQTIFQQRFNSSEIQLNMSDFPTGTYFVTVESDDRKETFKILKK